MTQGTGPLGKMAGTRSRKGGTHPYNYMNERMKLTGMLKRPAWVEYPAVNENGSLAEFPLIHASLGNGVEVWIADDDEGYGLLGIPEETRLSTYPETQWVVWIEHDGSLLARERSTMPTLEGLTATLRMALEKATEGQ